jgi:hypothetical protein
VRRSYLSDVGLISIKVIFQVFHSSFSANIPLKILFLCARTVGTPKIFNGLLRCVYNEKNLRSRERYKNDVDNYHIQATYFCRVILYFDDVCGVSLGAIGVPNKLFVAPLYSEHVLGLQFFKVLVPNRSSMV